MPVTLHAPSIDDYVTTEVESTPLVERISDDTYAQDPRGRPHRARAVLRRVGRAGDAAGGLPGGRHDDWAGIEVGHRPGM